MKNMEPSCGLHDDCFNCPFSRCLFELPSPPKNLTEWRILRPGEVTVGQLNSLIREGGVTITQPSSGSDVKLWARVKLV